MSNTLKKLLQTAVGAVLLSASFAASAAWPNDRVITLVVPFPPGGATDTLGRLVAHHLSQSLGQNVIVENKPGAGSMIGSQAVARATPDGYTFLVGSIANVLNHYFYKKPLYDIEKDLIPVTQLVAVPNYIAVNGKSKINSLQELIEQAKTESNKITCASSGIGSSPYLSCEMLHVLSGTSMLSVPYRGGLPAMQDVMGGQATVVVANEALPYIKDGRLKGIGVTTSKRSEFAPDLPAAKEVLPGFDVTSWYGVFAPAGTPKEIVARVSADIAKMMQDPESLKKVHALGATPTANGPAAFKNYVGEELVRWKDALKPLNISLD